MANKALPCPTLLRQLLRYEPETGKLFWQERDASLFKSLRACNAWNARFSGEEAFISKHRQGYPQGQIDRRTIKAHRVIWAMVYGGWPDTIDHIDGNVINNRIENLRNTTRAGNNRNARRRHDNQSGHQGVHWNKERCKWVAVIGNAYLGIFAEKSDAVAARQKAEVGHGFHENHGR